MERYETVIIGGGQAGLSVGYYLQKRSRSFVIVDASEQIGDSWRQRWDSLKLYSPAFRDGLPGMRFPAKRTAYPTKDEFADYLGAYAEASAARAQRCLGGRSDEGAREIRRPHRREPLRGGQRRGRDRRLQEAVHARLRRRARSEHHAAPLERLPESCRSCRRDRFSSSARATPARTLRGRPPRSTTLCSPEGHGADPGADREPTRPAGLPAALLRGHAHPYRGHADGSEDGLAHSPRWSAAAPVPAQGSLASGCRACSRARRRRQGRDPGARGGSRSRRAERCLVHRIPPRLQLDRFPYEIGDDGYPVQYRGAVASSPGLYFAGLPFLHSFASMLIGGAGRDAERVARHIVTVRARELEAEHRAARAGGRERARAW